MTNRKTLTLEGALKLARSGKSAKLRVLARALNGVPNFGRFAANDGGILGQIHRELAGELPVNRDFTVEEWIESTHRLMSGGDEFTCDTWVTTLVADPPPVYPVGCRVRPSRSSMWALGVGRVVRVKDDGDYTIQWPGKSRPVKGWRDLDLRPAGDES